MKKRNANPEDEQSGAIDLTPMLDVVFIMLIFFIVTATFIKEAGVEVDRPEATQAIDKKSASILIAVTSDDEIWIDKTEVDSRGVKTKIESLLAENPKGTVVIQSDVESSIKILVDVANAAREAGVEDIAVSTEKE